MRNIVGVESRGYPCQHKLASPATVQIVLVQGEANDVAAYIGISTDPQWVAENGSKLPFAEAAVYFPGFASQLEQFGLTYRA